MAKAKRKKPSPDTLRELFLKSGNQCAFPNCSDFMLNREGVFIGQICHIEAAEDGGERFNENMTDEERASFQNLMLMCYPHHQVTNDVEAYPVARLQAMKAEHEAKFTDVAMAMDEGFDRQVAGEGGIDLQGVGHRAVVAHHNSGVIDQSEHHHYYEPSQSQLVELNPTIAEVEILTRLADSQNGYLNAVRFDGGFEVLIDGQQLGGIGGGEPSVQLHEAVTRLIQFGLLTDVQKNGQIFHISSKGRDAAQLLREQLNRGERPDYGHIERTMPDLLREMREDFNSQPLIREIIVMDREGNCYNGGGVFIYYRSAHPNLDSMLQILENNDLIRNITYNNTDRYRVNEPFARYLLSKI